MERNAKHIQDTEPSTLDTRLFEEHLPAKLRTLLLIEN